MKIVVDTNIVFSALLNPPLALICNPCVKKRETDTVARVTNPYKRSHCDGADGSKPEIDFLYAF
jgi:hypothetical protein